ncbi:methylmalonyl-CoA epimerase [Planctomycetota bacterium]|nr:methylmalonyl-CoA epimerase [Planctomycetota bacterium]
MRLDHIGIAVKSIEDARKFYEQGLGLGSEPEIEEVAGEKVRVLKLIVPPGIHIELIEPMNDDSAIAKYLAKRGEGQHHICFSVDDIEAASANLLAKGYDSIYPQPRKGAGGCLVNFYHPKHNHGVLTELSQPPR